MSNICITGMGLVSGLGVGTTANFARLKAEQSAVAFCEKYPTHVYAAPLQQSNQELKKQLQLPADGLISRTALLGLLAAKEAWQHAKPKGKTAFINGTTVGGMDLTEHYFEDVFANKTPDANVLRMHDLGTTTNFIADQLGGFDFVNTISTACSSAANAMIMGAHLLLSGKYSTVLVGGVDALSDFTIQGFKSLMVYSDRWCMPFDEERTGLNLGEGAGYLLMELENTAKEGSVPILGQLSGWANANDAYHNTGTSPDGLGAQLAIKQALQKAQLTVDDINYINAHGTATQNNDSSELAAMQAIFANKLPPYSSTKGFTGHTLAAAGGIEACISLGTLQQQFIFPNLNAPNPIDKSDKLIRNGQRASVNHVLSNSFGFGGNCTSLIFSKYHG